MGSVVKAEELRGPDGSISKQYMVHSERLQNAICCTLECHNALLDL